VDCVSWLAADVLAVARSGLQAAADAPWTVASEHDTSPAELQARALVFSSPDHQDLWLFTISGCGRELGAVTLRSGDLRVPLLADPASICEARQLAHTIAVALDAPARARALNFLAATPGAHGIPTSVALAGALADMREELRTPLTKTTLDPRASSALRFEAVTAIDERAFWLSGWLRHSQPDEVRFTILSPEGERVALTPGAVSFHERADVDASLKGPDLSRNLGFHAYVELAWPSLHPHNWVIELRSPDGEAIEDVARNPVTHDHRRLLNKALGPLRDETLDEAVIEGQVFPTLERLRLREPAEVERLTDYGNTPPTPEVTIVIATSGVELMQHQLIGLCESELGATELLFVALPGISDDLAILAPDLHALYGVAFRVANLSAETGCAAALNLGAELARGRLLMLMRDNVIPAGPGWLNSLVEQYDGKPDLGALGPKLLYEDGSIAHAGTFYRRSRSSGRWESYYPLRGMAGTVQVARGARTVLAASDACMMVAASLFRESGGFCESYLPGEEQAADLCLALAENGHETWCAGDIELFHLERQRWASQPSAESKRFNEWLFNRRWGRNLSAASNGHESEPVFNRAVPARSFMRARPTPVRAAVEILDVTREPMPDWILDARVLQPSPGAELEAYAHTYSLSIEGWALGIAANALTVEVRAGRTLLASVPVTVGRKDVAELYPDTVGAQAAGFQTVVGTLGLPQEFEVTLELVGDHGERSSLTTITGRRRPLHSRFSPRLQPVLVTTLGRTGSSWLQLVLAKHPQITGCRPFVHDARLTSYWTEVLHTLAAPASYMQILRPELYPGAWWTGEHRPGLLPLRMAENQMAQWLGGESVETLAWFCQGRIEDFYREVARIDGDDQTRFFVEKCFPGDLTPRMVAELYPDGREILLVRDFRDMLCSILSFNAKRGIVSFGREHHNSDEEFILSLGEDATRMLHRWQERHQHAYLMRYEDLILEPESTLADAFSYVGVASDKETLGRTLASANAELPKAQRDHQTSENAAASIGRWQRELSPEHRALSEKAFGDVLRSFGYSE